MPATNAITTERLTLRPWRPEEVDELYDIVRRPDVTAWLGDPTPWTRAQTVAYVERYAHLDLTEFAIPFKLAIVPDATGVPVGSVDLAFLPGGDEVEIGWFMHPDAHGNGWATEAAQTLLDHALANGVERVWAGMWPHNDPSAAVCRRIGMTELGVLDDPWYGTAEYPLGRFFVVTTDDDFDPLAMLAERNAVAVRESSPIEPPMGPHGQRYPGT